jgi:hypothetical protein
LLGIPLAAWFLEFNISDSKSDDVDWRSPYAISTYLPS